MNRREFMLTSASALTFAMTLKAVAKETGWKLGCQSYCFRNFDTAGVLARVKELGLENVEFCSVHFPPAPENEKFLKSKKLIDEAGIKVLSYGVESFTDDVEASRVKFDAGKALGLEVLTADPTPAAFDVLDKLVEEYGIKIAIHNHGPGARYDSVEDTLRATNGHHKSIGACVDTGHVIRSGEKPHEVIRALGDRVHSLHLKDWVHKGDEQILGEGDLDLIEVAKALKEIKFSGPLMLEYELQPENPVPGMLKGLENWRKVCAEV